MSDNFRLVEGDGIITNIFYFLWKKKTDTGSLQATVPTSGDGCVLLPWERDAANGGSGSAVKFTPEFSVPSTVMFEHNYPKAWYYPHPTGKLSWEFERKLGKDIDSMSILKNFCPRSAAALEQYRTEESSSGNTPGGAGGTASLLGGSSAGTLPPHLQKFEERDFVAAYFSTVKTGSATHPNSPSTPLAPAPPQGRPQTGGGGGRTKPHASNDASGEEPLTVVEYMNEPQLRDFLLRRTKREDGFLQRWVWPNGKHNNVIQAIWTPHMCLVSRRTNQHAVRDSRETMYDRAVTYEGPSYLSGDSYVAPHVHWQVERFCADLVAYMFAEHHIPLRRMVLHFKVDWNSTVWFLWASSIRVQDKSQINLTIPYTARKELDAMRRQQALAAVGSQQLRQHHSARSLSAVSTAIDFGKPSTDFSPSDTTDRGQHDAGRERFLSLQAPEARKLIHMLEAEKHLSAIPFPKAPSMGAIGGVYTWGSLIKPLSKSSKPKKHRPPSGVRGGSDSATTANTANTTPTTKSTTTALVTRNNSLTGFPPPHSSTSSPAPKKLKKGRRGSKHHNSPLRNMLSPRFDDVLKSLQVERTTAFDSAMRHKDEREQHAALRRVLDDHVATLFGPHRHARTGKQLWAFVRHLVTSGYVRVHVALTEAAELLSLVDYSVYSHFLSSEDPLTFDVSPALAKGVPTKNGASCVSFPDMLRSIGLVVTEGTTSAAVAAALKPAAPKHPHSAGHRRKSSMARQLPYNMLSSVVDGSPHILSPVGGYSPTRTGGDSTAAAVNVSIASDGLPPPSSGAFFNVNSSDHAQRGSKDSVAQHDDAPVVSSSFGAAPLQTLLSPNVQNSEVSTRNPSFAEQGSPLNLVAIGGSTAELKFLSQAAAPPPSALQEGSTLCSVTITNTKKPIADVTASIKHTLLRDWVTPLLATSTWYMTAWQWILYRRPPHDDNEQDEDELGSEDEEGAQAPNGETVEGTCPLTGEVQQQATVEPPPAAPPAPVVSTERIQRKSTAGERFSLLAVVDALSK
ncbi:Hypothetical protein, putative [Bodo saltans]|uniref:Uncharacterized protein n=1 Tax=Bodo saltans TaxID=75058 RepID=A0A0S4ILY0_BODSA|nr:Hypothetical protein, putative [Bodo saltans]|eukprot:CUF34184.1 Hypothetical protein, putative [Bodo saltans]